MKCQASTRILPAIGCFNTASLYFAFKTLVLGLAVLSATAPDAVSQEDGKKFKVGDIVEFEYFGEKVKAKVVKTDEGSWPRIKYERRGREEERAIPPSKLTLVRSRAASTAPTRKPRLWTDVTGKFRINATFSGSIGGKVRLKKSDGSVISVPLDKLSEADREYLKKLAAGKLPAEEPGPSEPDSPKHEPDAPVSRPDPPAREPNIAEVPVPDRRPVAPTASAEKFLLTPVAGWNYKPQAPPPPAAFEPQCIPIPMPASKHSFHDRASLFISDDGTAAVLGITNTFEKSSIVRVIDLQAGRELGYQRLTSEHFGPRAVADKGQLAVTANQAWGKPAHLAIWKPAGGALVSAGGWELPTTQISRDNEITRFVGEDRLVVVYAGGMTTIWDWRRVRPIVSFGISPAVEPAFGANDVMAAVQDEAIYLVDLQKGSSLASIDIGDMGLRHLAFSNDGTKLAGHTGERTVIWDLVNGEQINDLWLIEARGTEVAWADDRFLLADERQVVDTRLGTIVWVLERDSDIKCVTHDSGNRFWAVLRGEKQGHLVPFQLPVPKIEQAIQELDPENLLRLEPGPISIEMQNTTFSASEQEQIRTALTEKLTSMDYTVQANAPLKLTLKVEQGETKTVGVREWFSSAFSKPQTTITYTPTTSEIKITKGNQLIWRRTSVNTVPRSISPRKDENVQQAANRYCVPRADFFTKVRLPRGGVFLPDEKSSLGESKITATGLE